MIDQPTEQPQNQAASNQAYFAYAKNNQRKYVKSRIPRPVKKRVKKAALTSGNQPVLKIADCTAHYIKTLMNPFDSPAGACLPADMFPLPSQKIKTFIRGQCILGTTGYGFCNASLTLRS